MAVIFDERDGRVVKHFSTLPGAKILYARKYKGHPHMVVCDDDYYARTGARTAHELVEVTSLMGGGKTNIRRMDIGGPIDPSTERYWSM